MKKIEKQLSTLYLSSILGNLSLTGAWVAILAARGYSLVEIGIVETVFHITSIIFEIPSGVFADVFGRKKMLLVSSIMRIFGNIFMICSGNLPMVCGALAFYALSENFASGTGDALAYDSLKLAKQESRFEKYESNQLILYRLCSGISTLCAGFALFLGYRIAYGTDLIMNAVQIGILCTLYEVQTATNENLKEDEKQKVTENLKAVGNKKVTENLKAVGNKKVIEKMNTAGLEIVKCFRESFSFLKQEKKVVRLMFCNSLVGAADILLLFFLQAKLPERGISRQGLGIALLLMQMGGIVGARVVLKVPKAAYRHIFAVSVLLVVVGLLAEHSPSYFIMTLGGFLSAIGDDALQVRTNARIQEMLPSKQRATLTSLDSFLFSMIMIVLTPLAGIFFSYY